MRQRWPADGAGARLGSCTELTEFDPVVTCGGAHPVQVSGR